MVTNGGRSLTGRCWQGGGGGSQMGWRGVTDGG